MTAPGWYPDPSGVPRQRYFDGTRWTEQYTPLQQPRKSRVWLWVLLSVFGVMVLAFGGCVAFVGSVASNMEEGSGSSSATDSGASVGSGAARDGKFEFAVTNVTTGSTRPNLPSARGTWVLASIRVTNIGNEPQSFFVGNQKLIDTAGREYAADDMAAMRINDESTMVLDLGPGFSLNVVIPFDVPPASVPDALVLHDSAFSGGVRIDIT